MCQFYKRLDRGTFVLPTPPREGVGHVEVDEVTFDALLDGVELAPRKPPRRPVH